MFTFNQNAGNRASALHGRQTQPFSFGQSSANNPNRTRVADALMSKGIGVNIKAEIAEAVADAVRSANAAKTAAAAERASEIAAQQVVVSEQQIAQAQQRLIGNSNARAGYSMGIPVPTPVLG